MSTATVAQPQPQPGRRLGPARRALSDGATLTMRVLLYYRHSPGLVGVSLAAPLAMLVVFGYVFGSAMKAPSGGSYLDYLIPGLFVLIAVNGIMPSMVGAARDVDRGMTDRLRSMPIFRPAALLGQSVADVLVAAVVLVPMVGAGLATGWRWHDGAARALAAMGLLLLFRFTMNWVGYYLGLLAGREDVAGQAAVLIFPVSMVTNVYVPTAGMPAWLRAIADWNPISAAAAAVRDLCGNAGPSAGSDPWPLTHPVAATVGWCALLLIVFIPLATRRFSSHGR